MAWGCFSSAGVGDIYIITDILTQPKYVRILSAHLIPSASRLIGPDYIFQQDNDPWPWPAQSPDLNPIENLWHHLKQEIRKAKVSHIDQLVDTIKNCWYSISPDYCKKLSDSMPTRIDETIRNKGSWTKY